MIKSDLLLLFSMLLTPVTAADGWGQYGNARFAYAIDVPPGFSAIEEAGNGDGGISEARDQSARLSVWGSNLVTGPFKQDITDRIASDASDGWSISYKSVKSSGANWSGSKAGRIFYARAIPACDGQAAFFQIEYDRAALKAFDPIIRRLVKSLRQNGDCL